MPFSAPKKITNFFLQPSPCNLLADPLLDYIDCVRSLKYSNLLYNFNQGIGATPQMLQLQQMLPAKSSASENLYYLFYNKTTLFISRELEPKFYLVAPALFIKKETKSIAK